MRLAVFSDFKNIGTQSLAGSATCAFVLVNDWNPVWHTIFLLAESLRFSEGNRKGAGPTRLERATSGVTGRRSNQLNYDPARAFAELIEQG